MSKTKLLSKIQASSRKAASLSKIIAIICIIGIVVIFIAVGTEFIRGKDLATPVGNDEGFFIEVDDVEITNLGNMIVALAEVTAELAILCIGAFTATKIFNVIAEDGIPFKSENSKRLKFIGELIIIDSFAPSIIAAAAGALMAVFSKSELDYSVTMNVDLGIVVIGMFFLLLTNIFSYGAKIQQENDDMV